MIAALAAAARSSSAAVCTPKQLYLEREDRRLEPALRRYLEGLS
jgi:hypothetical protein